MIYFDGPRTTIPEVVVTPIPEVVLGAPEGHIEELNQTLRELPNETLLLDRSEFTLMAGNIIGPKDAPIRAQFIKNEQMARGREATMNGVYFGQLVVDSPFDAHLAEFVAVKPSLLCADSEEVVNEWAANNYMNSVSEQERAYVPLGVWRDEKGMYQLLTVYDHSVMSYDNVFWAYGRKVETIARPIVDKALSVCFYSLGLLVGARAIHGDTRPKNMARDRKTARYIDLTEMELLPVDIEGVLVHGDETRDEIKGEAEAFVGTCVGYGEVDGIVISALKSTYVKNACHAAYLKGQKTTSSVTGVTVPDSLVLTKKEISTMFDRAAEGLVD